MSSLKLYHSPYSPFSRSALQLCRHLKLKVEIIELDLLENEHMRPEFLKINPQHCVPTLDDNGFVLWESRAILCYIAATKGQELLPKLPREVATVHQRLFSEMSGIAVKYAEIYRPLFEEDGTELNQIGIKELYEVLKLIEENYFPNDNPWIAGESLTVADFAYASTVAGLLATGLTLEKFPRLQSWFKRCQTTFIDFEETTEKGANLFGDWVKSRITKGF